LSAKKKTRIVVQTSSQISEIISIRERTNGDLILMPRMAEAMNGETFGDTPPDEYRISVHQERDWGGHTFLQHLRTKDGFYRRWYANVKRMDGNLLWPIMTSVCSNIGIPRYAMKSHQKDEIVNIGTYNTAYDTLFYSLIVASPGYAADHKFSRNQIRISFSKFDIILIWHYAAVPSCPKAFTHFPIVAIDFEKDGVNERHRIEEYQTSRDPIGIGQFLFDAFDNLSFIHYKNWVEIIDDVGAEEPIGFFTATRTYYATPKYGSLWT